MVCDSNKTTLIRKVLSDITPTTACGKIKELTMIGDCTSDTAMMSEESIEDLLEPCPQELWMSRTPSFWDEEMVDDDYDDRRSEEEEAERDFVEIMDILTGTESESSRSLIRTESDDSLVVGYSSADLPTIVISSDDSLEEEDDEELCALLYNDQNKQEFGNDAFLIPRPNADPKTPTVPTNEENASNNLAVPVTPPRPSRPAPFMSRTLSEDEEQDGNENEETDDTVAVFNEPPCVERLNRSVHFWDEMNSNEEEKEDQENTSSKAMVPSTASSTLASLPPPLLTTIPPPSVRRIPVKHSYRVTTEIEKVNSVEEESSTSGCNEEEEREDEVLIEDQEGQEANDDDKVVIVDFGPLFLVDRLRQSANAVQRSQESSHLNLEAALNLFRSGSSNSTRSAPEEAQENDSDCNTEATVAESMTSTTVDSSSVGSDKENKIRGETSLVVKTNIHLNCQRRVSMLEIREWKEEESWMKNSHVVLQDKSAIKGTTTGMAHGYYPNINKHTVLKEAMHIVPPRRQTIHIAMAA